ncbi:MAG TPA: peptidylprolyl isomerase [Verrucomicrobiae bacterium]
MKTFKFNLFCAFSFAAFLAAGCSEQKASTPATSPNTVTAAAPATATAPASAPTATENKAAPGFDDPSKLTAQAPETFKAQFITTKGNFTIEVTRALAPNGADRFYNLVRSGFFTDVEFFRVVSGFMCQFGVHGDPAVSAKWRDANISDDAVKGSNTRGTITFATAGPNTRTTQLFINFANNTGLDGQGFSPFGKVIEGMDVVDKINSEYGDGAPYGRGPDQGRIQNEGNTYLKKDFPNLDYIKSATIVP